MRKAARQSRASSLLEQLHNWLNQTLTQLSKKSALGDAILYALNRWKKLTRYCDDGRIEIGRIEMWWLAPRFHAPFVKPDVRY